MESTRPPRAPSPITALFDESDVRPFEEIRDRAIHDPFIWVHRAVVFTSVVAAYTAAREGDVSIGVALLFVSAAVIYEALLELFRRAGGLAHPLLPAVDIVMLWGIGSMVPGMTVPCLMFVPVIAAVTAVSLSTRSTLITAAVSVVAATALGLHVPDVDRWWMMAVAYSFVLMIVTVHLMTRDQRRLLSRHSELFGSLNAIVWEEDPAVAGGLVVSAGAEAILGYPRSRWATPDFWRSIIHPDDLGPRVPDGGVFGFSDIGTDTDTDITFVARMRHADGSFRWIENRVSRVADAHGHHAFFRGVMIDQTERMKDQVAVRRFAEVVRSAPVGNWVLRYDDVADPCSARVEVVNDAALRFAGLSGADPVGDLLVSHSGRFSEFALIVEICHLAAVTGRSHVERIDQRDGRSVDVECRRAADGAVIMTVEDRTEERRATDELRFRALHDPLTGLMNRAALFAEVERLIEDNDSSRRGIAVMVLDLNQFKEVNDALGHEVGDRLLVAVGRAIAGLDGLDRVARLGGDEFAVVMTCVDQDECLGHAQRIATELDRAFEIDGLTVHSTASIGVAFHPVHGDDVEGLLRHADVAMYAAKRSGYAVRLYDPATDTSSVRRVQLLGALREAGDRGEFELWAQPILDARTLDVIDCETLIRWKHPEFGWVYPDEFIQLAEVSGAIRSITRFVVERAIDMGHEIARRGLDIGVSCNVSARNLYESDFAEWVAATVDRKGIPAGGFTVELTETELMDDVAQAVTVMGSMAELGIDVWMDDFGTGYSSLAQLRSLAMNAIKIDRDFISRITRSDEDATIARWIIDLGHGLGLPVIAEGVEDVETLEALVGFGCDAVQGYYFARPMPFEYVLDLLESTGGSLRNVGGVGASALS